MLTWWSSEDVLPEGISPAASSSRRPPVRACLSAPAPPKAPSIPLSRFMLLVSDARAKAAPHAPLLSSLAPDRILRRAWTAGDERYAASAGDETRQ